MNYEKTLEDLIKTNAICGIDVSNCQSKIDFEYVEEKYPYISFAIIKMRDEIYNGIDSQFNNSWASISATRIKQMVYSVINPNKDLSQIMPTIEMVDKMSIKPSCIMLDFETPKYVNIQKSADMLNASISQIQCQTGIPVLIYTYYPFIKEMLHLVNHNDFAIANYNTLGLKYSDLPQERIKLKQYSGWLPMNGCKNIMCNTSAHNHGCYMELFKGGRLTAVDQDIFTDKNYYDLLKS